MRTIAIFGAAMLVAAPLTAQQPAPKHDSTRHQMMRPGAMGEGHQMMEAMMGPMMKSMAYTPAHLLERKTDLQLTPDQITRLTALRDAAKPAHDAAHNEARAHMEEVGKAMQAASPDTGAVKMHFQGAHNAMGRAHWTMLSTAAQARAILTDAQRAKVETPATGHAH